MPANLLMICRCLAGELCYNGGWQSKIHIPHCYRSLFHGFYLAAAPAIRSPAPAVLRIQPDHPGHPGWLSRPVGAAPVGLPSRAIIAHFPAVREVYNLSCEYAAASAITQFYGRRVTQGTLSAKCRRQEPAPGLSRRNRRQVGSITNYGIYAKPLVPVLERHGYEAEVFYASPTRLKAEIAAGTRWWSG